MAKALMGAHVSPSSLRLLDEVRSLRQRVAELEAALQAAESAHDAASRRPEVEDEQLVGRDGVLTVAEREPART